MRYIPLAGVVLLGVFGLCFRSWLQRRRYGSWGIVLFQRNDCGQMLRDGVLCVLFIAVAAQAVGFAIWPDVVSNGMLMPARDLSGSVALLVGLVLVIQAQFHLGASWRVGIDERSKPGLVVSGVYAICRNPIFVGMLIALAGLTLMIPTLLSWVILVGAVIFVRWQVLKEESYLRRNYESEYLLYARRVGRFLPWLGRLH